MTAPKTSPAPRRRPLRILGIALAVVVVLVAAYGAYWMVLSSQLEAGIRRWIAEREAEGYRIGYASLARGGFPRTAQVVMTAPAVTAPSEDARGPTSPDTVPWTWSTTRLIVAIDLFNPRRFTVDLAGAHTLGIGAGGEQRRYQAEAGAFTLVGEAGNAETPIVLGVRDLVLTPLPGTSPGVSPADGAGETLTIARFDARGWPANDAGADPLSPHAHLVATATGLGLPRWLELPLGHDVARIALEATVRGAMTPGPWPRMLFRWRDAGGVLDVAALEAQYGPLTITGSGTLALDGGGQPIGAFATRTSGLSEAVEMLQANGTLRQSEAMVAKLAVSVLAGSADRAAPVSIPLTLQDRRLTVGPITLMQMPEIHWLPVPRSGLR